MSSLKPPEYWTSKGRADYWLGEFIRETTGQLKYHDLFRLPPLVFDTVRDGWEIRITLKKQFVDNPDALVELIKRERKPRWPQNLTAVLRVFNGGEENNDED